jgi:hypothetical protein
MISSIVLAEPPADFSELLWANSYTKRANWYDFPLYLYFVPLRQRMWKNCTVTNTGTPITEWNFYWMEGT